MNAVYQKTTVEEIFAESRRKFDAVIVMLSAAESLTQEHSVIEESLLTRGMAVLKELFQAYLDLRSVNDWQAQLPAVTGPDGLERTHHRQNSRHLMSIFGTVTVQRCGYRSRGQSAVYPLDEALNLPPELYSHGLQQRAATAVATSYYDSAVEEIHQTIGSEIRNNRWNIWGLVWPGISMLITKPRSAGGPKAQPTC